MKREVIITIEGAQGAGKSRVADALHFTLLGMGANVDVFDGGRPPNTTYPDLTGISVVILVEQK